MKWNIFALASKLYVMTLARAVCKVKGHIFTMPDARNPNRPLRMYCCRRCGLYDPRIMRAPEGKNINIGEDAKHNS